MDDVAFNKFTGIGISQIGEMFGEIIIFMPGGTIVDIAGNAVTAIQAKPGFNRRDGSGKDI